MLTFALLSCLTGSAFAHSGGAGGLIFGIQRPDLSPEFLPSVGPALGVEHLGGYGYGVDSTGFIVGGFGLAFLDHGLLGDPGTATENLAGGVGGMIIGQRAIDGQRVYLDLCLRIGLGGAGQKTDSWRGWALVYAEPYAELLVAVAPWMALSGQVGYRFMGNLAPGLAFEKLFLSSPVLTFALSWGRFR